MEQAICLPLFDILCFRGDPTWAPGVGKEALALLLSLIVHFSNWQQGSCKSKEGKVISFCWIPCTMTILALFSNLQQIRGIRRH